MGGFHLVDHPLERNEVWVFGEIIFFIHRDGFLDFGALALQTSRKDKQSGGLDQADAFFFDVMIFWMCMEDAVWISLAATIVTQDKIDGILAIDLSHERRDSRMVAIRVIADDLIVRIAIVSPFVDHFGA